ncbi:hypothetical protein [Rhodococcus sp. NPDC058521]|uniref:hypothetical protein n=1 Tax=Rhodococcus sp. NPDC058521 TaxID=3346536 RepID=UPI00364A8583
MEQVSRYWEETADVSERSTTKTVAAMCAERKAAEKPERRSIWRKAVELLVAEGFATFVEGARNAHEHTSVKPYRQCDDPAWDQYAPSTADKVGKLKIIAEGSPVEAEDSDVTGVES